ncbi:MAG: hypothetical protein NVS2B14_17370 [Chamaesiphon sp.]
MNIVLENRTLPVENETHRDLLVQAEKDIQAFNQSYLKAGLALALIHEQKLYKENYRSFEEYALKRWDIKVNYAYKLINAARGTQHLCTVVQDLPFEVVPINERQARPLSCLKNPEDIKEAWIYALTISEGKPSTCGQKDKR